MKDLLKLFNQQRPVEDFDVDQDRRWRRRT